MVRNKTTNSLKTSKPLSSPGVWSCLQVQVTKNLNKSQNISIENIKKMFHFGLPSEPLDFEIGTTKTIKRYDKLLYLEYSYLLVPPNLFTDSQKF